MSTDNANILLPILKQIPLFSGLDENIHQDIISHIVLMYYPEKYTLFKEGAQGDALYIIKSGQIEIYHEPKEAGLSPQKIAEIGPQGFFGEMALVSEVPRNASAKTIAESEIFILSKDDFKKLLDTNTVLAEQISKVVVDRINENTKNEQ